MDARRLLACLAVLTFLSVGDLRASQVRPVNLEEMAARAGTIFSGRCTEARVETDTQVGRVTVVTFEVERTVKGESGPTVTIRMPGRAVEEAQRGPSIPGVPTFRVGEEVVLFLYGESALGLRSPVALGQGKFSVLVDKQGRKLAVNALGNENLLRDISSDGRQRLSLPSQPIQKRPELEPTRLLDMAEALTR